MATKAELETKLAQDDFGQLIELLVSKGILKEGDLPVKWQTQIANRAATQTELDALQ